jgi:small basic protein
MIIAIFGILTGVIIGYFMPTFISPAYSLYMSVAILASIDSLFGAIRANLEDKYDSLVFISGFFGNAAISFFLAYIGDLMGVPLYYAAVFVFGTRLFQNFSIIRRYLIKRF